MDLSSSDIIEWFEVCMFTNGNQTSKFEQIIRYRLYPFTNFSKDTVSSTEISEDSVSAESTEDNVSAPELVEEDQKLFDDIYYSCHAKKSSACSRTNEEATVLHIIDVMEAPLLFQILSFFSFCGLHLILAHSALQSCFVMGSKLLLLRAAFDIAFAS